MARTAKQWRKEVEEIFVAEGVHDLSWNFTGGTHQYIAGYITTKGGINTSIRLSVSLSPSDRRAGHRVRTDLRHLIQKKRSET